jgi:16S rRNA processing protein RimM
MKGSGDDMLLAVGQVAKAFGIHGDLVVRSLADSPERFRRLQAVHVGRSAQATRPAAVESVTIEARGIRIHLKGVNDRTAAEALRGCFLFVDGKHRARPGRGRYFVHEIVGLRVVDERGTQRGVVKEVLKLPAQDVYVIADGAAEYMLPAVREFVREVDLAAGLLRVRLIDGIREP